MHGPPLAPPPDVPGAHRQSLRYMLDGGEVDFVGHARHAVDAVCVNTERVTAWHMVYTVNMQKRSTGANVF